MSLSSPSVALAAAFPDLELFINLSGAIFLSTLGLLTPAIIDTVHKWDRGLGPFNWILYKNIFIAMISLVALFAGSFTSIRGMVDKFYDTPVLEVLANVTSISMNDTMTVWFDLSISYIMTMTFDEIESHTMEFVNTLKPVGNIANSEYLIPVIVVRVLG